MIRHTLAEADKAEVKVQKTPTRPDA
jgi:hypothetical protein